MQKINAVYTLNEINVFFQFQNEISDTNIFVHFEFLVYFSPNQNAIWSFLKYSCGKFMGRINQIGQKFGFSSSGKNFAVYSCNQI